MIVFLSIALLLCIKPSSEMSIEEVRNKVTVGVYYETYCPDSIAFITQQLWPAYNSIDQIMNIDLVPYGKAQTKKLSNGTTVFFCQHGTKECKGNMIQACLISLVKDIAQIMPFINCMESDNDPVTAAQKCSHQVGIDYNPIEKCLTSQQGVDFLRNMGHRTHGFKPKINYVPWITINSKWDSHTQRMAQFNLKRIVCKSYKGPAIKNCTVQEEP